MTDWVIRSLVVSLFHIIGASIEKECILYTVYHKCKYDKELLVYHFAFDRITKVCGFSNMVCPMY